jgi:hypothetical protein
VNRREAIRLLVQVTDQASWSEFLGSDIPGAKDEYRAALRALGVTDAEIDEVEEAK